MTRSRAAVLWWVTVSVLVACGPGVNRELDPSEGQPGVYTPNPSPLPEDVIADFVAVDAKQVRLRVLGRRFTATSVINLQGQSLETTFVSDTELVAVAPTAGILWNRDYLAVTTPGPGGGRVRCLQPVHAPRPELLSVSPESVVSDPSAGPTRVKVTGRNFVTGGELRFRQVAYPTTVLGLDSAEAEIPASALQTTTTNEDDALYFLSPVPYPNASNRLTLLVRDPVPRLEGVWPPVLSAAASHDTADGGVFSTLTLELRGQDLRYSTRVKWNGRLLPREQAYLTSTGDLRVRLSREDLTTSEQVPVTLVTLAGEASAPFMVPVRAGPALWELNPQRMQVRTRSGQAGGTLQVVGEGFGPNAVVYWDELPLATRLDYPMDGNTLQATIPPEELEQPGIHFVRVRRDSNGNLSEPLPFRVTTEASAPVLSHLEPPVLTAGGYGVTLAVHGSGFTRDSVIHVDGSPRTTSFVGDDHLSTPLSEQELSLAGVRTVTVRTPAPGGGTSLPLLLNVDARRPVPLLRGTEAGSIAAGSADVTLTLGGEGFGPFSVVRWNGELLPLGTQCCGPTHMNVSIPASLLRTPGMARVTVSNPEPGGGTSEAFPVAIRAHDEMPLDISQHIFERREDVLRFSVSGHGFTADTRVTVGGQSVAPSSFNINGLFMEVPAEYLPTRGVAELRVTTPGQIPNAPAWLNVTGPHAPRLQGLTPAVVSVGAWTPGQQRQLGVRGAGLAPLDYSDKVEVLATTLDWSGTSHLLTRDWSTGYELAAPLTGEDVARAGRLEITASRTAEGGTTSLPALLNVVAERPVPLLTSVRPATVSVGVPGLRVRLFGEGFHPSSVIHWNGQPLSTRARWGLLQHEGEETDCLEAVVPATDLSLPGTAYITVVTPGPGGGTSQPLAVRVE
ncbi:IPT/TIG domain-containing protein [Pyxidicoccus sp. 3LG]